MKGEGIEKLGTLIIWMGHTEHEGDGTEGKVKI